MVNFMYTHTSVNNECKKSTGRGPSEGRGSIARTLNTICLEDLIIFMINQMAFISTAVLRFSSVRGEFTELTIFFALKMQIVDVAERNKEALVYPANNSRTCNPVKTELATP